MMAAPSAGATTNSRVFFPLHGMCPRARFRTVCEPSQFWSCIAAGRAMWLDGGCWGSRHAVPRLHQGTGSLSVPDPGDQVAPPSPQSLLSQVAPPSPQSLLSQVAPPRQLRRSTLALLLPARYRRTGPPDQPQVAPPTSRDLTDDPPHFAAPTRLSGRRTVSSGLWRRSPPTPNVLWSCGLARLDPCRAAALLGMQLWLRRPRA
jgi:hypothetical protein